MDTKLQYKISLSVNTGISLLFTFFLVLTSLNIRHINDAAMVILIIIPCCCLVFLLFNYMSYHLLKANKENNIAPDWIKNYRMTFLVFTIIALVIIALMFIAATAAFTTDYSGFPKRQRPFLIMFLLFLLALTFSGIANIIYYNKAFKQNKSVVNSVINTLGEDMLQ